MHNLLTGTSPAKCIVTSSLEWEHESQRYVANAQFLGGLQTAVHVRRDLP